MDPRHLKRIKIVQNLFAHTFQSEDYPFQMPHKEVTETEDVLSHQAEIDTYIHKYAPKYPLAKMGKLDTCILRLALYELIFAPQKEPSKVVINEAVEIAKELGNERSFAFVNAVLGSVMNEMSATNES